MCQLSPLLFRYKSHARFLYEFSLHFLQHRHDKPHDQPRDVHNEMRLEVLLDEGRNVVHPVQLLLLEEDEVSKRYFCITPVVLSGLFSSFGIDIR